VPLVFHLIGTIGVTSYGAPRLPTISFLVQPTIRISCSLRDQLVQISTTHSSFDQYCISHKTISHRTAAAPGPEVGHRGCLVTKFTALSVLATNPGDATEFGTYLSEHYAALSPLHFDVKPARAADKSY